HDGYRMLARLEGGAKLLTRSGKDWTARMPHLARALEGMELDGTWLDGEVVVLGPDGRASFQRLQNAFDAGADSAIVYYVFDAPFLRGRDLRRLPLLERKKKLASELKDPASRIRPSEHLTGDGKEILENACKLGLEGLIAKQADAVYVSGRTR